MKKVSYEQQGGDVKRLKKEISNRKIENRQRFPFNRSYFQFYTSTNILCSYIDSTKELVILFCMFRNSPHCHIYTIDGYLMTTFSCGKLYISRLQSVKMFFSDRMFVLLLTKSSSRHELIQCNEYTFIRCNIIYQGSICFDCDQDFIYVVRTDMNYIDLYTHDVHIFRTIYSVPGSYIAIQVQNDSIFILNRPNSHFVTKLVQLSLANGETIRSFDICYSSYPYPKCISFHPLGYVIIGCSSTERLAILYRDKIVRYNNVTSVDNSFTISSVATTVTGKLVCASYLGKCIRVYPTV